MLKFELPEQMVVIILQCLAKQPYEAVAPAIMEMQRQIAAQRPQPETGSPTKVSGNGGTTGQHEARASGSQL